MAPAHAQSVEECIAERKSSMTAGLSATKVLEMRETHGYNELDKEEGKTLFQLLLAQFEDLLVKILLAAAVVSFVLALGDSNSDDGLMAYVEPVVILLILILNAGVGVWQESNAEAALEALKNLQPETAMALRDGKWTKLVSRELVPGDVVELRVGDKVPADLRLAALETTALRLEQSSLTGESQSVSKEVEPVADHDVELQGQVNILFASTTVVNGVCVGIVVATGMKTEIGKIQSAVQAAGEEEAQTPLQQKLDDFGNTLAKVIFVICAVVWAINYNHFFDPVHGSWMRGCIYYFKIAVALAVAAIPEGLPAVITTCLAMGTRKMAQKNAIVRRLPSVQTLGCTTVICSDKTGTLTTNEMCCVELVLPSQGNGMVTRVVEGTNYTPTGKVEGLTSDNLKSVQIKEFARCAALCNASRLEILDGRYQRVGEPTEASLKVLVEKLGSPDEALNKKHHQKGDRAPEDAEAFCKYWCADVAKLATLEFSRGRKSMSALCKDAKESGTKLYVKGAPEALLERCTSVLMPDGAVKELSSAVRTEVLQRVEAMAARALRTLALAVRMETGELSSYTGPSHAAHRLLTEPTTFVDVEQKLTFLGLVGIVDPPRPECKGAIEACRQAGVSVVMITGDNKTTAESIAVQLGIISEADRATKSLTGREYDALDEAAKLNFLRNTTGAVFSRTEPKHKQAIVKILRNLGEITAMTGDGVNDAPALKQADIGIAMGITGTEVAKEASDMVLADDNFSTIVSAVEEGRSIYNNMKAFIRYLISSNIGEVASIFFTAALGVPEGLAPVQLLWVNLVTDGPPATALGFNPPDVDAMTKPPRKKDEDLISPWVFFRYMVVGLYVGFATVGIFIWWYVADEGAADGHTLVSLEQLRGWGSCSTWSNFQVKQVYGMPANEPCTYFTSGKTKAGTLSLTVLVMIEMLNALNALSEDGSLVHMPPWANPYLCLAIAGSLCVHAMVLYVPFFNQVFGLTPLDAHDWWYVTLFSVPVIILDEILKFFGRKHQAQALAKRMN